MCDIGENRAIKKPLQVALYKNQYGGAVKNMLDYN
jgi:hypothetical protein